MTFRLPRLPRQTKVANPDGTPTLEFQRWWQSTIEKIEAQEAIQDQALIDIQTALTNAGIALTTATTALNEANATMPDIPEVTIQADYTGTVLAGQLPRDITAQRFDGDTDVTADSTWSATTLSGAATYTIGAATGILNVTAITSTTVAEIASVYNSITRKRKVTITKALQDPPPSSGTTTAYDSSITSTNSTSYASANAGPLTITCGASGTVDLSAPLQFTSDASGSRGAYGKWQVSASGAGVWSDVGTEIASDVDATAAGSFPGSISVNQSATGLTPASDYDFQLLLRASTGTDAIYFSGTATATTS